MKRLLVALAGATCVVVTGQANAQGYTFTNIFSGATVPGTPSVNNAGTVAFRVQFANGRDAILAGSGGAITTVADTTGQFLRFAGGAATSPSIDDAGNVAFFGVLGVQVGVFISSQGAIKTVASGHAGDFECCSDASPSIANGEAAFNYRNGTDGIYAGSGGPLRVVAEAGGQVSAFVGDISMNRNGTVASLGAFSGGGEGVFTANGGTLTTIIDSRTASLVGLGLPSINDAGVVAFGATLSDQNVLSDVLLKGDGHQLIRIADTSGAYSHIKVRVAINAGGEVAFAAQLKNGDYGIFTGSDPVADKVIRTGDPLFGSTVSFVAGVNEKGLNDAGDIAFVYELADGREGVARADPLALVPEPGVLVLLVTGGLPLVLIVTAQRRRARQAAAF